MAVFNAAKREIDIKIVYYGPALCGKTSNVQCVHKMLSPTQRGDIMSLATKDDRTLFFDFLPIELGDVKGFKTRFHVYTVPGQVYYALTRRAVLTGVDGVVFVADSQASKMDENIESLQDLNENLNYYKKDLGSIPFVMQYNKRDLDKILPVAELNQKLNRDNVPYFAASAVDGTGVIETLTACCKLVLKQMDSSGGVKKRRRQHQNEPSAPSALPQMPPPAMPAASSKPASAPFSQSFGLDDDDGPVIKIISDEDFSSPAPSPPLPSRPAFSATERLPGFNKDFSRSPGAVTIDDMPSLDRPLLDTTSFEKHAGSVAHDDDEFIPSLDAFEGGSSSASALFDSPGLDDFDAAKPAFDAVPKPAPGRDAPPPSPFKPAAGTFKVSDCGMPERISDTAVQMSVKLQNTSTGQTCSVRVTVSFDDFSV